MNAKRPSDTTVAYYDSHAEAFVQDTFAVDMAPLYEPFLALLPAGGHILDAGCGSGRDTVAFKQRGYTVTAIDASPRLAELAARVIGQPVEVIRFQDIAFNEAFDGIWACASLLHVPGSELAEVLSLLTRALRPRGALYMSFKFGTGEEVRDGRLFNSYTPDTLGQVLAGHPRLEPLNVWQSADCRPNRASENWANALARRR